MKSIENNRKNSKDFSRCYTRASGKAKDQFGKILTDTVWRRNSANIHQHDIVAFQSTLGNQEIQRLLSKEKTISTPLTPIQREPNRAQPATQKTNTPPLGTGTWIGEITGTWSAAQRKTPHKSPSAPHANTLADLPRGTMVRVLKQDKGWLLVEVTLNGKLLRGYVSHELVKFVYFEELVIDLRQDDISNLPFVIDDQAAIVKLSGISVDKALLILKWAETTKANDPKFPSDQQQAGLVKLAIQIIESGDKWLVNPKTYQVTFKQKTSQKIKVETIEDFILFVETVERQYPSAGPVEIASEIRQMWFGSDSWRAMLASEGIKSSGKNENIEAKSNPIARMFDMVDMRATGGGRKLIETPLGTVDISHVITGIDGALSGSSVDSDLKADSLRKANKGDPRDFVTWTGDLAQAYAEYLLERWYKENKSASLKYFVAKEASDEELLGDIHGYIAQQVWKDVPATADPGGYQNKVSNMLHRLYLVNKKQAGMDKRGYREYLEKVSGQKSNQLRDFIVERSLKFAPLLYAQSAKKIGHLPGFHVTKAGQLEGLIEEFDKYHQINESRASEEDKLSSLVNRFMKMLDQNMP
jgi:hypothetical protein